MKITNENVYDKINTMSLPGKEEKADKTGQMAESLPGYFLDISGNKEQWSGTYRKDALTMEELSEKMGLPSQDLQKMYMAVMSNTASEEDFAKMMEDGYQVTDMDVETMVTILDQIKVQLAKSGTEIEGYTDSIDGETLEQVVGNTAYAQALKKGLEDQTIAYMLKNEMSPTAENIYKATYSAGKDKQNSSQEDFWKNEADVFAKQIDQVIENAGLEVTAENRDGAEFILKHDIPLTEKSLLHYKQLKEFEKPLSTEEIANRIGKGLDTGKEPWQIDLSEGETIQEQAIRLTEDIKVVQEEDVATLLYEAKPVHLKNLMLVHKRAKQQPVQVDEGKLLAARKTVEEVRLRMTEETNLRLLRKGIQIDTLPIQQLLGELEKAQQELDGMAVTETGEIVQKVQQLQAMPMQVLGFALQREIPFTVQALYEKGQELQTDFQINTENYEPLLRPHTDSGENNNISEVSATAYNKATKRYEQSQTAPRADMGDSIKKAFRNVDDILADMGRDASEENRRAVRILGYNQIEITEENLQRALETDEKVQQLFNHLKPGRVLQMIREGVDVLHTEITELNDYVMEMERNFVETSESYARFLQKMERAGDITAQERESYIGIYRLMRQVEKSDGAAMGYVMASSAELTLENLLSAVRSEKRKQLDYLLDESFSGVDRLEMGKSITDQIQSVTENEQALSFLKQFHQPMTIANVISANAMLADGGKTYQELDKKGAETEFERYCDELADTLSDEDSIKNGFELFEKRTSDMLERVLMTGDNTLLDIKAMQSMYKQIRLSTSLAKESYYQIPVKLEDKYTVMNVHVKHTGDTPSVSIKTELEEYGCIEAEYMYTEDGELTGHIQCDSEQAGEFLERVSLAMEEYGRQEMGNKVSARELCQIAKIFLQTVRKEY